ncbi:MAG: hypothetical protein M3373_14180 [Gemmatimonadota bacterium]|nr:hypothetical protein [Gemmatimonadota bacterium]
MSSPSPRSEPTVGDLWRHYAGRTSTGQLASLAAVGVLAATAASALALGVGPSWAMTWWPLLLPALAAGAFGVWGIAAREEVWRRTSGTSSAAVSALLAAIRWLAALSAVLVFGMAVIFGLFVALGTWIS